MTSYEKQLIEKQRQGDTKALIELAVILAGCIAATASLIVAYEYLS